jgi:acyl-CoA thioester hydrolase
VSAAGDAVPDTLLIEVPIELRWRDLDALNHVNNAAFLTFLEEARLRWLASLPGPWSSADWMPVVAAIHVNYRRQVDWPADIRVCLYCERKGRTSLTIAHRIVDASGQSALLADGNTVMVWVEPKSGRPVALPELVARACPDAGTNQGR